MFREPVRRVYYNFATGESGMTAEAGQTNTKNPIVNNKHNNDISRCADSNKGHIPQAVEGDRAHLINNRWSLYNSPI